MQNLNDNREVLTALALLKKSQWGKSVVEWIKDSREEERVKIENENGNDLYRAQGRVQILSEFLKEVEEAPEAVANMHGV